MCSLFSSSSEIVINSEIKASKIKQSYSSAFSFLVAYDGNIFS